MPAETFRSTGEAAEGTFLSVDPDTNVQTFVTVFAGLSGPNDEPQVVVQVFQTDAAGYLFFPPTTSLAVTPNMMTSSPSSR